MFFHSFLLLASISSESSFSPGWLALKVLFFLILIIALLFVVLKFGRVWLNSELFTGKSGVLKVNGVYMLTPKRTLLVVSVKQQNFLIASHENGVELLSELDRGELSETLDVEIKENINKNNEDICK